MTDWWNPTWGGTPAYHPCAIPERVNARLGGITMHGSPRPGTSFVLRSLTGWWGGASWRGGPVAWDDIDGGTEGDVITGGRTITLRGLIYTSTGEQQLAAFDRLAAIWAINRWQTLIIDEPERGLSRQLRVSPRDVPDPQPISDQLASFSMMVSSAQYPLLGTSERTAVITPGGTAIENRGTYPANLVARLIGPLVTPGITWPGGTWTYDASIGTGNTIIADMTKREVRNPETTRHSRNHAQGVWPQVQPGVTTFKRTGSGTGRIEFAWRDSWA